MEYATDDRIREFYAEFSATEETIRRDVQYLIEWLRKQPHLPSIEDEEWLANFLLRGKNDVERTKMLIENYYTARAKMPEIFQNRGTKFFDRIKAVRELIIMCPLPKLTPDGYRLVLFRERFADGKVPDPMDTLKFAQMMFDLNLRMDKVRGLTLIYDYENTGLAFVKAFFPVIRRALMIQSKINPVRYNRLYHLNLPTYAQPILSFTASFLRKQMEKMIIWNKKPSELADEISPDCLPQEYGGKLGTTTEEEEKYFATFHEHLDWFDSEEDVAADLLKKPVTFISNEAMQGPDGCRAKLMWSNSNRHISAPNERNWANDGSFDSQRVALSIHRWCEAQGWAEERNQAMVKVNMGQPMYNCIKVPCPALQKFNAQRYFVRT